MPFGTDDFEHRHECVKCGTESPQTGTNYTLISSKHGWRLARGTDGTGRILMEWYCPHCWAKLKGRVAAK